MPKPIEQAVLQVGGTDFAEWTSVSVTLRWTEAFDIFSFTCAEPEDLDELLKIVPGNLCRITLAGWRAITGMVTTRTVTTAGKAHTVQIVGKSMSAWAAKSSVDPDTPNYDGKTITDVARAECSKLGVKVDTVGDVNNDPFETCQAQPGEKIWGFLERLARRRDVTLGAQETGEILLIGPHTSPVLEYLIEGGPNGNIESMQSIINNDWVYQKYVGLGQGQGGDKRRYRDISEPKAVRLGSDPRPSRLVQQAEDPTDKKEIQWLANFMKRWSEGTQIEVKCNVPRWLTSGGQLWLPGRVVWVTSLLHILDDPLAIKFVTFTQDERGGTMTSLDLVVPGLLHTRVNLSGKNSRYDVKADMSGVTADELADMSLPEQQTLLPD